MWWGNTNDIPANSLQLLRGRRLGNAFWPSTHTSTYRSLSGPTQTPLVSTASMQLPGGASRSSRRLGGPNSTSARAASDPPAMGEVSPGAQTSDEASMLPDLGCFVRSSRKRSPMRRWTSSRRSCWPWQCSNISWRMSASFCNSASNSGQDAVNPTTSGMLLCTESVRTDRTGVTSLGVGGLNIAIELIPIETSDKCKPAASGRTLMRRRTADMRGGAIEFIRAWISMT
mmetsp:Transcript_91339/g.255113  ORF Transcript_91339/g.255113 Transcript_91339/m.255113 type:complete len:229 (-) Transcript_91339:1312-1998(-)